MNTSLYLGVYLARSFALIFFTASNHYQTKCEEESFVNPIFFSRRIFVHFLIQSIMYDRDADCYAKCPLPNAIKVMKLSGFPPIAFPVPPPPRCKPCRTPTTGSSLAYLPQTQKLAAVKISDTKCLDDCRQDKLTKIIVILFHIQHFFS